MACCETFIPSFEGKQSSCVFCSSQPDGRAALEVFACKVHLGVIFEQLLLVGFTASTVPSKDLVAQQCDRNEAI
jgi:hypothetical protein